jgi:hypothetical protein
MMAFISIVSSFVLACLAGHYGVCRHGAIARRAAVLALLAGLAGQPAVAAGQGPAFPLWKLAPFETIDSKPMAEAGDIAHIRMLPASLLVLDADFYQDNGRIAVPKGTQLIGLRHDSAVACTIFPPKLALGAAIFALGADRHLCLIDDNRDGTFDRYYFRQTDEAGFYNLLERLPNRLKTGTGGAYRAIDSAEMTGKLDWTVRFDGCRTRSVKTLPRKICKIGISLSVEGFSGTSMGSRWVNYGRSFDLDLTDGAQPIEFFGISMAFAPHGDAGIMARLAQNPTIKPFLLI